MRVLFTALMTILFHIAKFIKDLTVVLYLDIKCSKLTKHVISLKDEWVTTRYSKKKENKETKPSSKPNQQVNTLTEEQEQEIETAYYKYNQQLQNAKTSEETKTPLKVPLVPVDFFSSLEEDLSTSSKADLVEKLFIHNCYQAAEDNTMYAKPLRTYRKAVFNDSQVFEMTPEYMKILESRTKGEEMDDFLGTTKKEDFLPNVDDMMEEDVKDIAENPVYEELEDYDFLGEEDEPIFEHMIKQLDNAISKMETGLGLTNSSNIEDLESVMDYLKASDPETVKLYNYAKEILGSEGIDANF